MTAALRRRAALGVGSLHYLPYRLRRSLIKRIDPQMLREHAFARDFFGLTFRGNVVNYVDRIIYFCGAHEKYMLFFLRDYVAAWRKAESGTCIFLDVGAHTGNHALFMSRVADAVHAFEPFARVRAQLEENIARNHLANVHVHPFGLGDRDAELPFYEAPENNLGAASFIADHKADNHAAGTLQVKQGDRVVQEQAIGPVSIIKADVEGFEREVLSGLKQTLHRDRPLIIIELSATTRRAFGDAQKFAQAFPENYRFFCFAGGSRDSGRYALAPFAYDAPPARIEDVIAVPGEYATLLPMRNISKMK